MNWTEYEALVHKHFSSIYPDAHIVRDAKILGQYSKTERQIDVLIEDSIADFRIRIAVDAKCFTKRVNVTHVEKFISMLDDIKADQGMMVTTKGYSDAAINRAHYGPHKLEVEILSFDELLRHQSIASIVFSGEKGVILPAPFGWVIDSNRHRQFLVCLYRRGIDLVQAQKEMEWMYCNIYHKTKDVQSIANLVEMQNDRMEPEYRQSCREDDRTLPERTDRRPTYIRVAKLNRIDRLEITGYVDFGDHIFFAVMFTKHELKITNLKKLAYLMKYSNSRKLQIDNTEVIAQLQEQCGSITELDEKADAYRQIADWYMQMDDFDKAMEYRRLCWDTFPQVYDNIGPLIQGELAKLNIDQAIEYSTKFFAMDPNNPRVMQDLLRNYDHPSVATAFIRVVSLLKSQYCDDCSALGNITFHYGLYLINIGCNILAAEQLALARNALHTVGNDQAIEQIDTLVNMLSGNDRRITIELGDVVPSYYTGVAGLATNTSAWCAGSSGIDIDEEMELRQSVTALADAADSEIESNDS